VTTEANTIGLQVNGAPFEITRGATVADLVERLGVRTGTFAVERNRRVVRRADHATTELAQDDRIEVVTFVGGG
jgi:sulfur carrier protein